MATPIVKLIRDVMIADLATIQTASGYNFNVNANQIVKVSRSPQKIDKFPEIALEIGQGDIDPDNSDNTSFESSFEVHLYGFVNGATTDGVADNVELIIHDLTKIVSAWHKSHANDATYKWIVNPERQPVTFERIVFSGELKGWGYCTFKVHVLTQPDSFDA